MARSRSRKKPKNQKGNIPEVLVETGKNEVRIADDVQSDNRRKISWQLGIFDWDGPWGRQSFNGNDPAGFIAEHIKSFESMSWNELPNKQHHSIDVSSLNKCAQDQLVNLQQEDIDQIFSLRLKGAHRLYGIKDGSVFKALWYDVDHGDNDDCVCRSRKKHT